MQINNKINRKVSQVEILKIPNGYPNLVMHGDCKCQTYTVDINCNTYIYIDR
jgi:hypothetical protein